MAAYLRTVLPGLLLWWLLWRIDGRPYSVLPWLAGAGLIGWMGLLATLRRMPLGFLAGIAQSTGLWALWRLTDSATGPALMGSGSSQRLLPFTGMAFGVAMLVLLTAWPKHERNVARWLLFVLFTMLIIGTLSGQAGSPGGIIRWLMATFDWKWDTAETVVVVGRKTVHFTFYGLSAYGAFWAGWHAKWYAELCAAFGLGSALFLGSFDESRQFLAIGRTGSAWDVGIDMLGAAFFVFLAFRAARRRERVQRRVDGQSATFPPSERN